MHRWLYKVFYYFYCLRWQDLWSKIKDIRAILANGYYVVVDWSHTFNFVHRDCKGKKPRKNLRRIEVKVCLYFIRVVSSDAKLESTKIASARKFDTKNIQRLKCSNILWSVAMRHWWLYYIKNITQLATMYEEETFCSLQTCYVFLNTFMHEKNILSKSTLAQVRWHKVYFSRRKLDVQLYTTKLTFQCQEGPNEMLLTNKLRTDPGVKRPVNFEHGRPFVTPIVLNQWWIKAAKRLWARFENCQRVHVIAKQSQSGCD